MAKKRKGAGGMGTGQRGWGALLPALYYIPNFSTVKKSKHKAEVSRPAL